MRGTIADIWSWIMTSRVSSCMTSSKLLNLFGFSLFICRKGIIMITSSKIFVRIKWDMALEYHSMVHGYKVKGQWILAIVAIMIITIVNYDDSLMNVTFYVPALIRNSSWLVKDQQRGSSFPMSGHWEDQLRGRCDAYESVKVLWILWAYCDFCGHE